MGGLIAKENYYMGKDSAGLDSDNPYTLVKKHYEECVNSEKFWEVEKECSNKEQEEYCNVGYPDYIYFLKKIMTDCPNHAEDI